MIGKILLDKFGATEFLGGDLSSKKIKIIPEIENEVDFEFFVNRINELEKDPVQVDLYLKTHGLEQVEGLKDYILNNDIKQDSVNNLIQAQNYKNIADQAHGFKGVNTAIKEYNKLTDTASRTKLTETISRTNSSLGNYLSGLNGANAGMKNYGVSLATATAKTIGLQAATMAMNTAISMGVFAVITTGINLISYLIHKEDELAKKAKELGDEFNNTTTDIDSYKSKIEELKRVISDSSSSYEEVIDARRSLLGIQEELIEKYGSEVEGINAITEAINGETDALDDLKQAEWYDTKKDYNAVDWKEDALNGAKQVLTNPFGLTTFFSDLFQLTGLTDEDIVSNTNTHLEDLLNKWNNQEINLPESGNKNVDNLMGELLTKGSTDWLSGDFTKGYDGYGSVSELKDKLGQIKAYATAQSNVDEGFLNALQSVLDSLQETYEQNYQIVSNATLYDKIKSDDISNTYDEELNKLEIIKAKYDDALLNTDEEKINEYAQQYADALNAAMELAINNGDNDVSEYFYNMFPAMKDVANKLNFKDLLSSDSSLQKDSQSLNRFNKEDILTSLTSKQQEDNEKAFKTIREKAIEDGIILNDSIEETEKLIDLLVEWGILKDKAQETANNETTISTTPLSFKEAWKALGTTGDEETQKADQEAKEKLLELAKAGELTIDAFRDSSVATQFLKDTGLSAEETTKKINELVDATQQLSALKTGITAITSAYDEKKDAKDKRVGVDTLESMRNTLGIDDSWSKKDLQVWEDYKDAASDAGLSLKDFKKYQDDLATSYVNSENFLANLTTENQNYYDSLLTEMGITNAHEITTKLLADSEKYLGEQKNFATEKGKELTDATSDEIQKFIEEHGGAENASNALLKLALEKELCNKHVLDFSGDCSNLLAYVQALGGATKALRALQAAQNKDWATVKALGYDPSDTSLISKLSGDAEKEIEKANNKQVKTNTKTTSGNKSSDSKSKKSSKDSKKGKTALEKFQAWISKLFDWIEIRIQRQTEKID